MDTCAFGALELMNNEVEIIKAICKGCGTCVASCPVEAIDILHFSDEQILAQVDAALAEKPENKILVFTCHWCALGAVDNAGVSRFEYPANIRIIRVMCSGRVDPQFVLRAFELGVRGVLIAGCEMPTCHYMTGNYYAEKKVRLIKKLLELVGIDITRLRLEWLSAAEGARFAQIANEFNAQLDKLGPLNKDDFSSRDLKAALSCANSSRLRILASKSKEFVESGNKYHELFTNYELNRLLDEIVYDEFINEKIIYSLNLFGKKKPGGKFIKALAADLNIPTKRVFKNILSLIKAGLVELDYIKERSPSYKLTNNKSDNTIDPIQALNRINPEEGSSKEENDTDIALPLNKTEMVISTTSNQIRKFDCLIVGTDIIALSNALKLANENNKVCILSTTASFLTDPALLHNDFISYQQYYEDYRNLIEKCYGNENITIFRNSRIETEDKTGPVNHLKIRKKATFVIDEKCDNCGKCLDICPVNLLDFDTHGLTNKHAIYRPQPFTNSVKPVISKSIPYCMVSCPIEMDIRGYIGKIADSDIAGSMEIIRQTNPLPDICGKVCNHDCENTCARKFKDEALEIRKLKRFSVETMYREFSKINKPILMKKTSIKNKDPTNKVAIIGSGPAGLAAAHDLAQLGYPVTIFESEPEAGGMLKLGIPGYRLPPDALQNELDAIISLGVELKLKSRISKDLTIDDLKEQGYKAIFIAIGTQKSLDLGIEGTKYSGVINGLDFLKSINRGDYKISAQIGKNVVVIGGGNVAIDCARTAKRLGAENVNILYRRTRQEMPAADDEIDECEAEGVIIEYLTVPTRIIGAEVKSSGKSITKVKTLECQRTRLGPQDLSGRRRPIVIEGSEFTVDVDTILVAVGQQPDLKFLSEKNNFELTPKSTFKIDPFTSSTNIEGVFAGGDAVTGPATVIDAIKGGKIAAYNIDDYLNGDRSTHQSVDHLNSPGERRINELELIRLRKNVLELDKEPQRFRAEKRLLDVNQRISNFAEVELLISLEDAKEEAKRCLSCRMCIGCGVCQAACPQNAIDYSKTDEFITIETNKISEYPILSEGKFDNDYIRTLYSESLNVITPLELYYMLNPAGVYKGIIQRPSDGEIPGGIIFIHYPETEFINEEIKRSNNLEFEFLVRQIKYLKKTNPEINISLLTNSEPLDDFPGRYQYLSGTENKLNELEKEIEIIKQDEIEYNYNNETGNIEIKNFKNNKEKKEFDLAVVSTGYQKV